MAKKTKAKSNGKAFLIMDAKKLPIVAAWGTGPEVTHPKEFEFIDAMKINQSAIFPRAKVNIINAIRTALHKRTSKRYIVRKIDPVNNRIWRLADNSVISKGGRIKGVSPYKKDKPEKTES